MSDKPQIPPSGMADDSLRNYLVEEFVEDYQEGHITRREVLKKLAMIFGSMVLANNFLAACAPAPTAIPVPPTIAPSPTRGATATVLATTATTPTPTANPITISPDDPAIEVKMVEFDSKGAKVIAYLAKPKGDGPFPILLLCHENRGLTEHIKDVARRAAKAGYATLAVDLLSRQGGTDKVGADVPGVLGNTPPQQFVDDFRAGLMFMQSQPFARKDRAGMVGFCFGGGVTWRCATQIAELRAAVPFYGPNPPLEDVPKTQAAVLAIYGALDTRITGGAAEIEAAMKQNNKTFEKIVYPNANHAFHNDTGASYNPEAAKDAWTKTLAWLDKYVRA